MCEDSVVKSKWITHIWFSIWSMRSLATLCVPKRRTMAVVVAESFIGRTVNESRRTMKLSLQISPLINELGDSHFLLSLPIRSFVLTSRLCLLNIHVVLYLRRFRHTCAHWRMIFNNIKQTTNFVLKKVKRPTHKQKDWRHSSVEPNGIALQHVEAEECKE